MQNSRLIYSFGFSSAFALFHSRIYASGLPTLIEMRRYVGSEGYNFVCFEDLPNSIKETRYLFYSPSRQVSKICFATQGRVFMSDHRTHNFNSTGYFYAGVLMTKNDSRVPENLEN